MKDTTFYPIVQYECKHSGRRKQQSPQSKCVVEPVEYARRRTKRQIADYRLVTSALVQLESLLVSSPLASPKTESEAKEEEREWVDNASCSSISESDRRSRSERDRDASGGSITGDDMLGEAKE